MILKKRTKAAVFDRFSQVALHVLIFELRGHFHYEMLQRLIVFLVAKGLVYVRFNPYS